jgi:hypothetical protein
VAAPQGRPGDGARGRHGQGRRARRRAGAPVVRQLQQGGAGGAPDNGAKHEIAGLRPQPGARPAETLAHRSPNGRAGRFHNGRDRPDIDDYDDAEKRRKEDEIAAAYYEKLLAALDVDIRAAGPEKVEEARKASIAMRLSTIAASIPHPTLDACLAEHGIAQLWTLFGPRYGSSRAPPFG